MVVVVVVCVLGVSGWTAVVRGKGGLAAALLCCLPSSAQQKRRTKPRLAKKMRPLLGPKSQELALAASQTLAPKPPSQHLTHAPLRPPNTTTGARRIGGCGGGVGSGRSIERRVSPSHRSNSSRRASRARSSKSLDDAAAVTAAGCTGSRTSSATCRVCALLLWCLVGNLAL